MSNIQETGSQLLFIMSYFTMENTAACNSQVSRETGVVGGCQSVILYRTTLDGQLYTYCCFVSSGSKQILLTCMYMLQNTRAIPINNKLDPMTVFPLGLTTKC